MRTQTEAKHTCLGAAAWDASSWDRRSSCITPHGSPSSCRQSRPHFGHCSVCTAVHSARTMLNCSSVQMRAGSAGAACWSSPPPAHVATEHQPGSAAARHEGARSPAAAVMHNAMQVCGTSGPRLHPPRRLALLPPDVPSQRWETAGRQLQKAPGDGTGGAAQAAAALRREPHRC